MTRIYYTRDKIHLFDSKYSDKCLKCSTERDSLIQTFWYCRKIQEVWDKIEKWMSKICNRALVFTPDICIFQDTENMRCPIIFSSLVYKKLILHNWKKTEAPSLENWKNLMKYYLKIERTMSEDSNKEKQFDNVWTTLYEAL